MIEPRSQLPSATNSHPQNYEQHLTLLNTNIPLKMRRTLVEAIRFRWLLARLSKSEYFLFLEQMFDISQGEWIGSLSFKRLDQEQQRQANEALHSIIESRESEETEATLRMDTLPRTLLGHSASFLNQQAYYRMARASRVVFLSLNSPNKLIKVNLSHHVRISSSGSICSGFG